MRGYSIDPLAAAADADAIMDDDSNPMDRGERGCQPPQRAFCSSSQQQQQQQQQQQKQIYLRILYSISSSAFLSSSFCRLMYERFGRTTRRHSVPARP